MSSVPYKDQAFTSHTIFFWQTLKYRLSKSLSGLENNMRECCCGGSGLQFPVQQPALFLQNLSHPLSLIPSWTLSYQPFLETWFTTLLWAARINTTQYCFLQVITERNRNHSGKQNLILCHKEHHKTCKLCVLFHYKEDPHFATPIVIPWVAAHFWHILSSPSIAQVQKKTSSVAFNSPWISLQPFFIKLL